MKPRIITISLALAVVLVGHPSPSDAHRLDEYLQASRISVDRDRVTVEVDLTPGVEVAAQVIARIDSNRDGRISKDEGAAYANEVVRTTLLSVDHRPVRAVLEDAQFPSLEEMTAGVGVIRLRASATIPAVGAGVHEVFYRNDHQPEISVYLANALVPSDDHIEITGQRRDYAQHELAVDYRIAPDAKAAVSIWLIAGLITAGIAGKTLLQSAKRTSTKLS